MKSLETCYEINLPKINFIERKIKIENKKTIINGPTKTGKSYLIFDFLSNFKPKEYLYIDFHDFRTNTEEITSLKLQEFINSNEIKVVVLENFDFQFDLPNCENIIISSQKNIYIENFKISNE